MDVRVEVVRPGFVRLAGTLELAAARELAVRLREVPADPSGAVTLALAELEVDDGPACAAAVDAVRALVKRGLVVTLEDAPHVLAHVLYRVAMLPAVRLVRPREELPTSS